MPMSTSHWSWPGLTRAESGSGSGRSATLTFCASSISFLVRWKTKIGFERQNTLMICPSAIGARSTSIGAPAAMVEASGFICAISGTSVGRGPHRADGAGGDIEKVAARVLRRRHGRHVLGPLLRLANSSARGWSPGPKSRGGGADRLRQPWKRQDSASVAFYWHPCSSERKPAKARPAKVDTGFASGRALNVTLSGQSGAVGRSALCPIVRPRLRELVA